MITGAHTILYSSNPEADREFFKTVLKFPHVDIGHGWLIFGLPPSEVAVHPSAENGLVEFYLLCDDINSFVKEMAEQKIACTPIDAQRWGNIVYITLPGDGKLGVYQAKHERPK
ncbi:MAG: hypothetical protein WDN26_19330 [Chitinophagaceae bacterium]